MHQMQFPKVLAFVEGSMERMFINLNFHYVTVIPVANGRSWSASAMGRQISSFYKAKNFNADTILVWIDRESRQETPADLRDQIREDLTTAGAPAERIHILVADKMSENIILADECLMRTELNDPGYVYEDEGKNGKHVLSSAFKERGIDYKETKSGVALLKKCRLAESAKKSPSVAALLETLTLPCWWLEPRPEEAAN